MLIILVTHFQFFHPVGRNSEAHCAVCLRKKSGDRLLDSMKMPSCANAWVRINRAFQPHPLSPHSVDSDPVDVTWLLRPYNPDLDFDSVNVGVSVTVPKPAPIEDPSPAATTTASAAAPQAAVAP